MEEYIYIILSRTETNVAKIIRLITKKPYNHCSVATDLSLDEMYSFCRTYNRFPLPATFNQESVGKGTFGEFPDIPCEIYRFNATPEQRRKFVNLIEHFKKNRLSYSYNIMGFWSIPFNLQIRRKNKFVCSQFVAYMLKECGVTLEKSFLLYSPEDFRHMDDAELIYEGELNRYHFRQKERSELPNVSKKKRIPANQ